jgi:hypothetical protein
VTPKHLLTALAFLLFAALTRFWIAPLAERLPAGYAFEAQLTEENRFRDSPGGEWQESTLSVRRVDQTITTIALTSIIEGSLHVYYDSGEFNFETTGLYGVDQRTRLNLADRGDAVRSGQYLFPTHTGQGSYQLWDPMFIGQRLATFERLDQIDGLRVYVFSFHATGMDESAGYSYLADVPERYLAHTDGQGTIWVEPLSGVVVDYEDSGTSYFVNPTTGARLAEFNQREERYTPETQAAQLELARSARLRLLALEDWLPGGLVFAGLCALLVGASKRRAGSSRSALEKVIPVKPRRAAERRK